VSDHERPGWPWLRERLLRLRPGAAPGAVPGQAPAVTVRTAVVTDSAAALPADWARACTADGRLAVVPMPVMVGAEIYGEDDDIADAIAVALASDVPVKTSRPSPGQLEQAYLAAQNRGFESVVSIHISGELSGTADSARLAAARVGIPVEVLDSRTVGMAQGMGVQSAIAAAAEGWAAADVRAFVEERLARTRVYFYVPSLEQLRRGGRIGATASLWATMFSIKPILAVEDGRVVPLERVRSAAKAVGPAGGNCCRRRVLPAGRAGKAGRASLRQRGRGRTARVPPGRAAAGLPAGPGQCASGRAGSPCRARRAGRGCGGEQHAPRRSPWPPGGTPAVPVELRLGGTAGA